MTRTEAIERLAVIEAQMSGDLASRPQMAAAIRDLAAILREQLAENSPEREAVGAATPPRSGARP